MFFPRRICWFFWFLLTLSKFVDVGLDPEMYGRILNIFCIRFLDLLFWQFLLLIQTYFTSRNFLSDYFSFINLRAFAAIVLRLHIMTLNYFNKLCKFPFRKHVRHLWCHCIALQRKFCYVNIRKKIVKGFSVRVSFNEKPKNSNFKESIDFRVRTEW